MNRKMQHNLMRLIASTQVTLMIQLIAVAHVCGAVNSQKFTNENDFDSDGIYATTKAQTPPTPTTIVSSTFLEGKIHHSSSKLHQGGGVVAAAATASETTTDGYPMLFSENDTYVPSKPLNLTVLEVTATTINISWHAPENNNGDLIGYRIFYVHRNETVLHDTMKIRPHTESSSYITFTLSNLKPFTEYKIFVKAFTWKNEGERSDFVTIRTDIAGPSAPIVVNLTCNSQDALFLRFKRPEEFYNTIDFYMISHRATTLHDSQEMQFNASASHLVTSMIIPNLTTKTIYEIKVRAATYSIINPKQLILGSYSEPKKILMQPDCEKIQLLLRTSNNDYDLAVLVGIVFSCFGIILIVMAFLLWRRYISDPNAAKDSVLQRETSKCFHAAYYYLDDPPCQAPTSLLIDWEAPIEVGGEVRAAVSVNDFNRHVSELHADGDIGFSKEYESIQNDCGVEEFASEHSQHPENKGKNRYLNIIAYDHSRVHLRPAPGQKKSLDYINANFIDGYQKARSFIGTQGPLPGTFDCFWRMIWEQRVAIIVMITNLVERGRRKCDMYWPKDGTETYGVIQVKMLKEDVMATYTVRTLQIKHLKLKKKKQSLTEKIVYQYHYTNWPDHGTPDHPLPVLNFVKKSSAANPPDAGPIVVHCSAGVGRTGTYIVLDAMLKQIQEKGLVNVFGFLRHIRAQRNFLVQTEEQYIFIHDALCEAIQSGETNIRANAIKELANDEEYMRAQFELITQFTPKEVNVLSAMKPVNNQKNRSSIVPLEGSRVHLTPRPGEDGSDYINGSWLQGFRQLRDFIVTQHPMHNTIKDFWQMIWDHNAQTIVLLTSLDDISFMQFWPDESMTIEGDYYRVKFLGKTNKNDYVCREFCLQSIQDDYELNVKMLHCPSWPEMSQPSSIFNFIVDVHQRSNDYKNGPIVVVDGYGGTQACTFCVLATLAMQMEYDQTANIYTLSKLYHNKRPGVWLSYSDLRLIYAILSYLPSDLGLLKCTEIRTELEDCTTATPDLYSKICSNGNITSTLNPNCNMNNTNGAVVVKMNGDDRDEDDEVNVTDNDKINV